MHSFFSHLGTQAAPHPIRIHRGREYGDDNILSRNGKKVAFGLEAATIGLSASVKAHPFHFSGVRVTATDVAGAAIHGQDARKAGAQNPEPETVACGGARRSEKSAKQAPNRKTCQKAMRKP